MRKSSQPFCGISYYLPSEKYKSHQKEKSAARLKAIINELNPKVEGVRKVTLLEEVADCVLPWLEQLDIVMAQKLGKFQSTASPS